MAGSPGVVAAWIAPLLDLLFPALCPACGLRSDDRAHRPFCARCWATVSLLPPRGCPTCGIVRPGLTEAGPCGRCRRTPPPFAFLRAVATYEGAVRAGIHALKYHGRTAVGVPLGALLAEAGGARLPAAPLALLDAIVPVPLHPARQAERGFNQAELLARACGRRWGLPVWPRALRRVRPTRPQTELDGAARRANVRGAFAVSWSAPVAGRRLLLVDDVLTTGATLGAAATALRAAGATLVGALVLARASGEDRTPSGRGAEAIRGSIMAEFSPSPVSGSPGTARGVDTHGTEGRSQRIRSDRPRVLPGGLGHPRSRGGGGQRPR